MIRFIYPAFIKGKFNQKNVDGGKKDSSNEETRSSWSRYFLFTILRLHLNECLPFVYKLIKSFGSFTATIRNGTCMNILPLVPRRPWLHVRGLLTILPWTEPPGDPALTSGHLHHHHHHCRHHHHHHHHNHHPSHNHHSGAMRIPHLRRCGHS